VNDEGQYPAADLHELSSLYALGALEASERLAFEAHLAEGCKLCAEDVRSFEKVAGGIAESVAAAPSEGLRERLLSKVKKSPAAPGILLKQGGLLIARSDEFAWQAMAPGIAYKPLYEDAGRMYNTSLVRMDAGARYPSHHHAEIEELFVLSGDLHVENEVMRPGDYCRGDSGTMHGETFSEAGCLFLLMASQENRIVGQPVA
jgi:anti-sigma factor ChrR (cupin superfamily)